MLKFEAQGYYTWIVLNQKDEIVRHAPTYERNLILNQGLDGIATRSWADSFVACAVGTGNSTATKTQTGLDAEVRRTNTYLDLVNANSSSLTGSSLTLRRTFVFPQEGSAIIYREAGFSHTVFGPAALFSRIRLPNVLVSSGERIIIQYELVIRVSPTTATTLTNPIVYLNRSTSGVFQYQLIGLKGVNSLGVTYNFDAAQGCNEPSTPAYGFLSTDSSAPATFGSSVSRGGTNFEKAVTLSTYVPGTYTRNKVFTPLQKEALNSSWRSAGLGALGGSYLNTGLVHVFTSNFPKTQGTLNLSYNFTWDRLFTERPATLYYWLDDDAAMLRKENILLQYFRMESNG